MNDQEFELFKRRLGEIEFRLSRIEERMEMRQKPPAPPVLTKPLSLPKFDVPTAPIPVPVPREPAAAAASTEYQLGGQILPWLGAIVTLLAIGIGVSLAYRQGIITPQMIFGGGVAICLAFIGVGQWLRDAREQFGQILTGVGSCGLYLTFAAGHQFQHLYDGETLVALFTGLSLANLIYSFWRSSGAFFVIGVLGGFTSVLMPMQEQKFLLSHGLYFLILVPSALIAAKNRWEIEARALLVVALFVLLPLQGDGFDWRWRVAAIYAASWIGLAAYARCFKANLFDPDEAFPVAMAGFYAGLAFLVHPRAEGSAGLVLYGVALLGLMQLQRDATIRGRLAVAGVSIPLLLAPLGLEPMGCTLAYAGLALALAAVGQWRWARPASVLGQMLFVLSVIAYLVMMGKDAPMWGTETLVVAAVLASGLAATVASCRASQRSEVIVGLTTVALLPLSVRLFGLLLGQPSLGLPGGSPWVWGLVLAAIALSSVGRRSGLLAPVAWSGVAFVLGLVGLAAAREASWGAATELVLIGGLVMALVTTSRASWDHVEAGRETLVGWSSLVLGLLAARAIAVVVGHPAIGAAPSVAGTVGLSLVSAAMVYVAVRLRRPSILWASWATLTMSAIGYMNVVEGRWGTQDAVAATALLVSLGWVSLLGDKLVKEKALIRVLQLLLFGAVLTRWLVVIADLPGVVWEALPAVTVGWTLYAGVLLVAGFAARVPEMRYVGLATLGATALKLILVDLASTNEVVRFLVTLALGLAMIGGGYLYIRLGDRLKARESEPQSL